MGVVGHLTGRQLATGGYRIPEDEADHPPGRNWWPGVAHGRAGRGRGLVGRRPRGLGRAARLPALRVAHRRAWSGSTSTCTGCRWGSWCRRAAGWPRCSSWRPSPRPTCGWVAALVGAVVMGAVYLLISVLPGGGVGGGDVRLAPVIGALLGWLGLGPFVVGLMAGFFVGGVAAIALLALRRVGLRIVHRLRPGDVPGGLDRHLALVPDHDLARGRLRAAWKDSTHAALADRWGVARARARGDHRRAARGGRGHHRRRRRRARAPPAGLRPRRPDEVRAGRGRVPRRGAARPHPRVADRHPGRQLRVAQVADRDEPRPGRRRRAGRGRRRERREGDRPQPAAHPAAPRATPTSSACRSTPSTTPARCSSGPRRARPPPGSRSARWPRASSSRPTASGWCRTPWRSAGPRSPTTPRCRPPTTSRPSTPTRCAPSTPGGRPRWSPRSRPPTRTATPSAGWSRWSSPGCRPAWARTCTGTAGSTRSSRGR